MALRKNTGMINAQAEFNGELFDGGTLEIYTSTQPSSANDSPTGSLLATISIPTPAFGSPSGGVVAKAGSWSATASATGTAGWARFISADTNKNMDVACTDTPGSNDLLLNDLDITMGDTVTVVSLTYAEPAN